MTARSKIAETDCQIQALQRHVAVACVAIASSLDTLPAATECAGEMRGRWRRAVRQTIRALELVAERLT